MESQNFTIQSFVSSPRTVPISRVITVRTLAPGHVSAKRVTPFVKQNDSLDFLLAGIRGGDRLAPIGSSASLLDFYNEREKLLATTSDFARTENTFHSESFSRTAVTTFPSVLVTDVNTIATLNTQVISSKSRLAYHNKFRSRRLTIRRSRLRFFNRIKSKRNSRNKISPNRNFSVVTKLNGDVPEISYTPVIKEDSAILAYTSSVVNRSHSAGYNASTNSTVTDRARLLSYFIGAPVKLTIIPAFSFVRYGFDLEALELSVRSSRTYNNAKNAYMLEPRVRTPGIKGAARFLTQREIERGSRYTSVAVYLPDLLRITFVSRYIKTASVLAQFLARSLADLPRTRKETQFLRFLIKVVKVFAAQRKERLGVRIQRDGRVNRWRRTKRRIGTKGHLPFHTYDARRERGIGQAITKKGTRGIRLWFCYHPSFARTFRVSLLSYIRSCS
jgi:hypothetical protein